jgi:hypothetical protein
MRLIRQVAELEAAAAARAEEPAPIGVCWTTYEERVEARELEEGEYIAADMTRVEELAGTAVIRIRERVTLDVRDLGWVYDAEGARIGRVVAVDGTLVSWKRFGLPVR